MELREHQIPAVEEIARHFKDGVRLVCVSAPTGCLAGDTEIGINRAKNGRRMRIDGLVHRLNGGQVKPGRYWDNSIPTYAQRAVGDEMRLGLIEAGWDNGAQQTFEVVAEGAPPIRATRGHNFLTDEGWKALKDLQVGDYLARCEGRRGKGQKKNGPKASKIIYKQFGRMFGHPYANLPYYLPNGKGPGWRVPVHRAVAEADMNGLPVEDFVERCRDRTIQGLKFIDTSEFHVHHIDGNPRNNDLSNLKVMTAEEHLRLEGKQKGWKGVAWKIGYDPITSIEPYDIEPVYDLTMADDPHNYIANTYVVHNSGKSYLANWVRQHFSYSTTYVTVTKTLQEQLLRDFPEAAVLKGRNSYPTANHPEAYHESDWKQRITCEDCTGDDCPYCPTRADCPYMIAKIKAKQSQLICTNFSYFLHEANHTREPVTAGRDLCVLDEACEVERQLMGFVEVDIGPYLQKRWGIEPPEKKTVPEAWMEWFDETIPHLNRTYRRLPSPTSRAQRRTFNGLSRLIESLVYVRNNLDPEDPNFIYDGYKNNHITWKPLRVDGYAPSLLWSHARRFIAMSATIEPIEEFVESLGWDEPYATVEVPSVFHPARRPVYYTPVARVTKKNEESACPRLASALRKILDDHPDERILVHTVSFKLTEYLLQELQPCGRVMAYRNSRERESVIRTFEETPGAVLLAPSMERGYDGRGSLVRLVVVCKLPWLYLDKQTTGRLYSYGGRQWYEANTARTLTQMLGRHIRAVDDFGRALILDGEFGKLWRRGEKRNPGGSRGHRLLPAWLTDALHLGGKYRKELQRHVERETGGN